MPVLWRARVLTDIERIVRYIATHNAVAAKRVGREFLIAGDSLALFPHRGRPGRVPGTRELVTVQPYILVYRPNASGVVTILRI